MKRLSTLLGQKEFHVLLFFCCLFLFFLPILRGDNQIHPDRMFFFLFLVWGIAILIQFFISRVLTTSNVNNKKTHQTEK
ncbi:MAG: hypothetical protein KKE17_08370 [Proteobacteria bacterium]|nr:hypothetical protein [Pseudomonadota bacterium]MBU1710002.1 hypothetical protein [Pseudomonadota bacterium]